MTNDPQPTTHVPLRHTLASLAYRGGKTLREAPADFANFRANETSRTPLEILTHIGDLIEWALSICEGRHDWKPVKAKSWDEQVQRFFAVLEKFDQRLASGQPLGNPPEKLFQGPIADAFTRGCDRVTLWTAADNALAKRTILRRTDSVSGTAASTVSDSRARLRALFEFLRR